jgi:hypothetical protein
VGGTNPLLAPDSITPDQTNTGVFYGIVGDAAGGQYAAVAKCTYSGNNAPAAGLIAVNQVPANWTCVNLTPHNPNNYDLGSLAHAFNSAVDPALITAGRCFAEGAVQGTTKIRIKCWPGQDTGPVSWALIFDTAVTPGPSANPVVATMSPVGIGAQCTSTASPNPHRWGVMHTLDRPDDSTGKWTAMAPQCSAGTCPSTISKFSTTLAAGIGPGDLTMTVNGEPGFSAGTPGAVDVARVGDFFWIQSGNGGKGEVVQITSKNGNTWGIARAAYDPANRPATTHASGDSVGGVNTAKVMPIGGGKIYWNWDCDTVVTDTGIPRVGHFYYKDGSYVGQGGTDCAANTGLDACWSVRMGLLSTTLTKPSDYYLSHLSKFAGITPAQQYLDSHPSFNALAQYDTNHQIMTDAHTLYNWAPNPCAGTWTNPTGALWVNTAPNLHPRSIPTAWWAGTSPVVDVSGPNSRIDGTSAYMGKGCYKMAAGECSPAGTDDGRPIGSVYINYPYVTNGACLAIPQTSTQAEWEYDLGAFDAGIWDNAQSAQHRIDQADPTGTGGRLLTNLGIWRRTFVDYQANGKVTPGNEMSWFSAKFLDGRSDIFAALIPPTGFDSLPRDTFVPVPAHVTVPPGQGITNVLIEYGYWEQRSDLQTKFYCTSRRENCVANSTTPATGATYEIIDAPAGLACSTACTPVIPAIAGRMLYWRPVFRNASSAVVATGVVQTALP